MNKNIAIILFLFLQFAGKAQFYNGHQMTFGKHRVQYDDFYWQYYRYPDYDIYYNIGGRELADYVSFKIEEQIEEVNAIFNYRFTKRLLFIIYNTHSDFKQSNIGSGSSDEQYNIGGTTNIVENKVILYFEGDHSKLDMQIRKGVATIIAQNIFYRSNTYSEILTGNADNTLPDWYFMGLIEFVSDRWNCFDEDILVGILNSGEFPNLYQLEGQKAINAGAALWYYIAKQYGDEKFGEIIYMTRLTRNIEEGYYFVLNKDFNQLIEEAEIYYKRKLLLDSKPDTSLHQSVRLVKNRKSDVVFSSMSVSNDGSKLIYTTNELGQFKVWLYDINTHKKKRILKREFKLQRIVDYSYPQFTWHPSDKLVAVLFEEEGKVYYSLYEIEKDEFYTRQFHGFDKVLKFKYSPDGYSFVLSAVSKGQTDVYIHDIASHTNSRITNDLADDIDPEYSPDGGEIIFSSNRTNDSLVNLESLLADNFDLYGYRLNSNDPVLKRYTSSLDENELSPQSIDAGELLYVSDFTGVKQIYFANKDSIIENVDTVIHYRYYLTPGVTSIENKHLLTYAAEKGSNRIYSSDYRDGVSTLTQANYFKQEISEIIDYSYLQREYFNYQNSDISSEETILYDTAYLMQQDMVDMSDTIIDFMNYKFEMELYKNKTIDSVFYSEPEEEGGIPSIYQTHFYINKIVNQIDFGFLGASYQIYNGQPIFFNPGLNIFIKLGIVDLFEDYRVTGGFKIGSDFESNEFVATIENNKLRFDKQLTYHRQTLITPANNVTSKVYSNEVLFSLKYPFNPVSAASVHPGIRYDKIEALALEPYSLRLAPEHKVWSTLKVEYVFDNSFKLGLNSYKGMRLKTFSEVLYQLNDLTNVLFVWGGDCRIYTPIHRSIIWANRLAYSGSVGTSPLLYYMGGVDNWLNLFSNYATFNNSVSIDDSQQWAFQTLATNMRGFNQNTRNGNSFGLLNSEIRIPVVKYFFNTSVSSEFVNNFQVAAFFDLGTAWNGIAFHQSENAYNYRTINNKYVEVVIDKDVSTFIYGYGFGVRSKLFGYFIRADWAWGVDSNYRMPMIFYISLSLDF